MDMLAVAMNTLYVRATNTFHVFSDVAVESRHHSCGPKMKDLRTSDPRATIGSAWFGGIALVGNSNSTCD
jgi:hypothetical protein